MENRRGRRRPLTARNSAYLAEENIEEITVGLMNVACGSCGAVNFNAEKIRNYFSICCQNGNVELEPFRNPPQFLQDLLSRRHPRNEWCASFLQHVRAYNGCLAFASMNAQLDTSVVGHGRFCFRIHGQVYHATSALYPVNQRPRFSQIYVMDANQAEQERLQQSQDFSLLIDLLRELEIMILEINPFASSFRMMRDVERTEARLARENNTPVAKVKMYILSDRSPDSQATLRLFNPATANEIAAVFVSQDGMAPSCCERDLTIFPRINDYAEGNLPLDIMDDHEVVPRRNLIKISRVNPNCDPMVYPLLFPFGDHGFRDNIPHRRDGIRNKVTMREYYCYILQRRSGTFSTILLSGKLFHQYLVDAFTRVEGSRLDWIRFNQAQLRVENYQGLMDHVNAHIEEHVRIGRRLILPSSFPGSPRAMAMQYQDAMAIVRELGKPDLFVTFTCNPHWPEIVSSLLPNQTPEDRPDLVSRVFSLKLKHLMDDIRKRKFFGEVSGFCYTIEFQKRGLPHAHILIILANHCKIRDANDTDMIVSAELPSEQESPRLYNLVKSHMVHGPCGDANPSCPCMVDGNCSKSFPKDFSETTIFETNGYPRYKRSDDGRYVVKRGVRLSNQWVVPYNRTLLLKYNAHINVEVCSSIKSVKYIYKYIYKGHDRARVVIAQDGVPEIDEIAAHLNARYVSASEASWRIFSFKMHGQSHTIIRLAVHLENMQQTFFTEGEEQSALEAAQRRSTTLLDWFRLNQRSEEARSLKYCDVPKSYTYHPGRGWQHRRIGRSALSRMYFVSPKEVERFHLRILLLHVTGAQSFADLRTYQGTIYDTFRDAALARGLTDSDDEWVQNLEEACTFGMPRSLRHLFATILVFCTPSDPLRLFDRFEPFLCEDFLRNNDINVARNECLRELSAVLETLNSSLEVFGLPNFDVFQEAVNIDVEQIVDVFDVVLNDAQRSVYDAVFAALEDELSVERRFFVDGPGGSGKTTLYRKICSDLKQRNIPYLAVASTGIASTLLPEGRTAHSAFKLPLNITETSTSMISCRSREAERLRNVRVIIWDEVTMVSAETLRVVNDLLKDVSSNNLLFGNKVVVLGGDFRQCLPIVRRGTRQMVVEACLKSSPLWGHFTVMPLEVNMRASGDQGFSNWLLSIGSGQANLQNSSVIIPNGFISSPHLVNDIFGVNPTEWNARSMRDKCILSPKNDEIAVINELVLGLLNTESREYLSSDSVDLREGDNPAVFPTEFLNSLTPSGLPPHRLKLKIGCIIILLRNLNPIEGLYNGTRLIVKQFSQRNLICSPLYNENKTVFIPRIDLAPTDSVLPFTLRRRQFPVRLAYAMSINKSQGQTFGKVGIFLPKPVFSHGQLYVALSRVRRREDVKIQMVSGPDQGRHLNSALVFTKNIVYQEVLH